MGIEASRLLLQPARARIYGLLSRSEPLALTELANATGQTVTTILWHLKKLEAAGLVVRDASARLPKYRRARSMDASVAEATRVLHSVPARELMGHLIRNPGQHLGEAAQSIGASRSRYRRVLPQMERVGLVRVITRGRARLLFPTSLARAAVRAHPDKKMRRNGGAANA